MPFGRGHAAIIAVVVIIVTSIGPVLCITQCLLAYLQLTLRCLDMKSVLFQLFQAFLFVAFLILGCYPCHLRLDSLLLLTSDDLHSVRCALACQSPLHLGDCARAQFIRYAKNFCMHWLRSHCTTKLTLGECKLQMDIGTARNLPKGCPFARTILVRCRHHNNHLAIMGEAAFDSGQRG